MNHVGPHIGHLLCTSAVFAFVGVVACGGKIEDSTRTTSQAVSGSDAGLLTISGVITDSTGNSVGTEVLVSLNGSAQKVAFSNPFTGAYSFTVKPGSYSITPSTQCLTFTPDVVNLNNLTANATVNFVGSGNDPITNCSPLASSGGTSGSVTLSGHVTSAGHPVPGAQIKLNGSSQGFRYADMTGAYSFSVNPGSYSLNVTQGCNSYSPNVVNLNNLNASKTQDFVGSGNCPPAPLMMCPFFDAAFQLSSLGDVCSPIITTNSCLDRFFTWQGNMINNLGFVNGTDCRFGKFAPPLFNDLNAAQTLAQLSNFILYFFGCPFVGSQIGPLVDGLVPAFLLAQGFHFTTADLEALSEDFIASINQTLSDNGSPALTSAQLSAIQAQLDYLEANVPGQVNSSTLSFSTCAADAGH